MSNRLGPVSLFKRLHKATWCAMLLMAVPLVLIIVPGEWFFDSPREDSANWINTCFALESETDQRLGIMRQAFLLPPNKRQHVRTYEHGWPHVYLARVQVEKLTPPASNWPETLNYISWCHYNSWPLGAERWLFYPWALMFDLCVAATLIGGAGGLVEWRIYRRGKLWKFNLADLLVGLTIVGVVLGYVTYHWRVSQREDQLMYQEFFLPPNHSVIGSYLPSEPRPLQRYCGPVWLRCLLGGDTYLEIFRHNTQATVRLNDNWRAMYGLLPTFPYLQTLDIRDGLPLEALEQIRNCPRLKTVLLPRLRLIDPAIIAGTDDPLFRVEHLSKLRDLALKRIGLRGEAIEAKDVEIVATFPGIEQVTIFDSSVSYEQQQELNQRYPDVVIMFVESY